MGKKRFNNFANSRLTSEMKWSFKRRFSALKIDREFSKKRNEFINPLVLIVSGGEKIKDCSKIGGRNAFFERKRINGKMHDEPVSEIVSVISN
jgi:hypothetical protein